MTCAKPVTISTRVTPRVRELAETVARLSGITLSAFVSLAVEDAVRHEVLTQPRQAEEGEARASR